MNSWVDAPIVGNLFPDVRSVWWIWVVHWLLGEDLFDRQSRNLEQQPFASRVRALILSLLGFFGAKVVDMEDTALIFWNGLESTAIARLLAASVAVSIWIPSVITFLSSQTDTNNNSLISVIFITIYRNSIDVFRVLYGAYCHIRPYYLIFRITCRFSRSCSDVLDLQWSLWLNGGSPSPGCKDFRIS